MNYPTIHDIIYHCKKGPTKVYIRTLYKVFDTTSFREVCRFLDKERVTLIKGFRYPLRFNEVKDYLIIEKGN